MQRRSFLALSMGAVTATCVPACNEAETARRRRLLVLGGTNFVGPAIVERALERGHEVTLFNRGITRPHLFPAVEKLRGDRDLDAGGLDSIEGTRHWDAVIDVWPERSALVERTTALLADRADYYFFISSIAVYSSFDQPGITETARTRLGQPGTYGGEKALAERALEVAFPGRWGVARCHAIVGPRDNGTAYHYWLRRFADYDEILAPGSGEDLVQYVDVRDVGAWTVDCVERSRVGAYNLCGPAEPLTFREFLEGAGDAVGSDARLTWVGADFLRREQGVRSFSDMPFWAPLDEDAGFYQINNAKALAAGMAFRPLSNSARAAWRWYRSYFFKDISFPASGTGISREREIAVLDAWKALQVPSL